MKIKSSHSILFRMALALPALSPAVVHAQFPIGAPWDTAAVQTIGGVTYFTFGGRLPNCHWIETGPMDSSPNGFSLPVWEMVGDICLDCVDCYNLQTNSIVLGKLPPGEYRLQATYSMFPGLPQPGDPMVYSQPFIVPPGVEPTLTVTRVGSTAEVTVKAAPAAEVAIQASTDLRRWSALPNSAPVNGPFTFTVNATNQFQFFRAAINSGSVLQTVNGGFGLPLSTRD
jgi:hypothetical protein